MTEANLPAIPDETGAQALANIADPKLVGQLTDGIHTAAAFRAELPALHRLDETAAFALAKKIKAESRRIEKLQTELTRPHRENADRIRAYCKNLVDCLAQLLSPVKSHALTLESARIKIEDAARQKKLDDERKKQEALDAEQRQLEADQKAAAEKAKNAEQTGDTAGAEQAASAAATFASARVETAQAQSGSYAAAAKIQSETSKKGATRRRTLRGVSVVDEDQLPAEYWAPDLAKITKAVRAGLDVPGVKADWDETLVL